MNKFYLVACALVVTMAAMASKPNQNNVLEDEVLMSVDGRDVKVSEFEYLYNKNNLQQLQPQTIDEYLEMFVDFKLKVADALNAGIDTTQNFRSEYLSFRKDLAEPHMQAKEVEDSLVQAAYDHMLEEINVSHIMFARARTPEDERAIRALADSIRQEILNGNISFEEAALQYSNDNGSKTRGGLMGWVPAGRLPYAFEDAAYHTAVGGLSPVVNSGFGNHIIKVNDRRPSRGMVKAAHILKLTRDLTPEQEAVVKAQIDSIYQLLQNPNADFAEIARRESQDPGSAMKGGDLDWFGTGQMVAEFDSVAFALADGEISKPFKTSYGYHIIKRADHRGVSPLEDVRADIMNKISQDDRANMPRRKVMRELRQKYNSHIVESTLNTVLDETRANGGLDSVLLAKYKESNLPLIEVNGKTRPMGQILSSLNTRINLDRINQEGIDQFLKAVALVQMDEMVEEAFMEELAQTDADYFNLLNEYHEGILLWEISNRNVWDKATKDKEGLEKFFNANRANYRWDKPHYKGYVVFAENDSTLGVIKDFVAKMPKELLPDSLTTTLRENFGKKVKVERVLAGKGDNEIIDYLGFGGKKPESKGKWAVYFDVCPHIADQPEEYIDVRGQVTTDYQNQLNDQWIKQLRKKYRVKINKDVLKRLNSKYAN